MTGEILIPELHPEQKRIRGEASRFNVLNLGRRWGKTTLGVGLVAETAIDEGAPCGWFAPRSVDFWEVWLEMCRIFRPVASNIDKARHRIDFPTGGVLEMWSLWDDPDAGRSRKYRRVIFDEAAKARHLKENWENAVRATLMDMQGDGWFLSTPRGRNYFYKLHKDGQDRKDGEWRSWTQPTSCNPYIKPAEIEKMRRMLPERKFRQEVLAEFLDDGGGVFRKVREAATAEKMTVAYPGTFVMGIDWGKVEDFTVLVVIDVEKRRCVDWDRFNKIDFTFQRGRVQEMARKWNVAAILAESNSIGTPNIEELQRAGLPVSGFATTNETKTVVIEALTLDIEQGRIQLPDDKIFTGELESYEVEMLPSGRPRYSAPEGEHDDTVIALALANKAAGRYSGFEIF